MMNMNTCIKPGQVWLDTEGKRIQAHGGSIITVGDTFYWYGENKEKTIGDGAVWHWGVRAYSSKDLYNWKDEGVIIPPDLENEKSPVHPKTMMDRPHIIYNEATKKYVAWLKIMDNSSFAVLAADVVTGPYEMVNPCVFPCGLPVGDFDLQVDPETKKGYLISQKPHTAVYVADLDETYTNLTGKYSEHFHHEAPPESREAPAYFKRGGLHYLITSGTTGYYPNPSEAACATDWHGPYEIQGDPHVNDTSKTSFCSQITSVFKHPGKRELYIALADRWKPELVEKEGFSSGEFSDGIQDKFHRIFDPEIEFIFTEEDAKEMSINSSVADYVWLPLKFDGETVQIEWLDSWKVEDFE